MDKVPFLSIIFMMISCLTGFLIPVILFLYFRKKKQADIIPFFVGCLVFMVFVLFIEATIHKLFFITPLGRNIRENIIPYAIYGGVMAALFEEFGRLIAFKLLLGKNRDKNINACMYGAGHGGFEALAILGFAMINNLVLSFMINIGSLDAVTSNLSGYTLEQLKFSANVLITSAPYIFLIGIVERIIAVAIQISLSVLVWFSLKKKYLFLTALFIHFFVDALVIILAGIQIPVYFIELILALLTVMIALFARKIYVEES